MWNVALSRTHHILTSQLSHQELALLQANTAAKWHNSVLWSTTQRETKHYSFTRRIFFPSPETQIIHIQMPSCSDMFSLIAARHEGCTSVQVCLLSVVILCTLAIPLAQSPCQMDKPHVWYSPPDWHAVCNTVWALTYQPKSMSVKLETKWG